jgi:hypothetical protein
MGNIPQRPSMAVIRKPAQHHPRARLRRLVGADRRAPDNGAGRRRRVRRKASGASRVSVVSRVTVASRVSGVSRE